MANDRRVRQRLSDTRASRENTRFTLVVIGLFAMTGWFLWNVSGLPIFGHYISGFVIYNEAENIRRRAAQDAKDDASATKYLAEQRIAYNPHGCAYYVHANGDIKAPVFTREGPLCDGMRK